MKNSRFVFLLFGVILLVLLFVVFGVREPVRNIIEFGWKFWICFFIHFINHIFLAFGWMVLITHPLRSIDFFRVLLARIAGDSATTISVAASFAGDAVKALYLKETVPFKKGLASIVLDRTIHMVGNTLLILLGIMFGFFKLNMPIWSLLLLFLFFVFFLLFLIFVLNKQKKAFIAFTISKLPAPIRRWIMIPDRAAKINEIDKEIAHIFSSKKSLRHFIISLFCHTIPSIAAGTLEVYIILYFTAGSQTLLLDAMLVYLFGLFITSITFFVPLGIGTNEGSYCIALYFLGYPDHHGLVIGMIRRFRALAWSGVGLLILFQKGFTPATASPVKNKSKPISKNKGSNSRI